MSVRDSSLRYAPFRMTTSTRGFIRIRIRYLDVLMLINMIYKKFHSPNSIDTVVVRIVEKDEDDNDIIR